MTKAHAAATSLMVGVAAIAGVFALTKTVSLGQASTTTPITTISQRTAALDRAEAQIAKLKASTPPALPAGATSLASAAPRVEYVRATQEPGSSAADRDDDSEYESRPGSDDGEEEWDD